MTAITLLAWRPLLDPMNLHTPWQAMVMLLPLIVSIALVYKTLKTPDIERIGVETAELSLYIVALMVFAALILRLMLAIV